MNTFYTKSDYMKPINPKFIEMILKNFPLKVFYALKL